MLVSIIAAKANKILKCRIILSLVNQPNAAHFDVQRPTIHPQTHVKVAAACLNTTATYLSSPEFVKQPAYFLMLDRPKLSFSRDLREFAEPLRHR